MVVEPPGAEDGAVSVDVVVANDGAATWLPSSDAAHGEVDWNALQITEIHDEYEGRFKCFEDDQVFELLGLRDEEAKGTGAATKSADKGKGHVEVVNGALPHFDDSVPGERVIVYDPDNPCMDLGSVYPDMKEFRLAIRQFAINEEFALDTEKTDPTRYIGN